jgi:dihydrolipoamide dehydrogenase
MLGRSKPPINGPLKNGEDLMLDFDVVVIGSGPGGYVCAIKAAQLGLKVACIEGENSLGGTCLNVGCIPSKALLHASEAYHDSIKNFSKMGIDINPPTINWPKMLDYKSTMVSQNSQGIEFLFKKNKIIRIKGWASIETTTSIRVEERLITTKNIVIATGSKPTVFQNMTPDNKVIVNSTGALSLKNIPKKMIVIGAGVIGLEMGSIFSRIGSEVTVIEYLDHIAVGMDREVSKSFQKILKKQGINFLLNNSVTEIKVNKNIATVRYEGRDKSELKTISADLVLIATGRKPYTSGLGLENVNLATNKIGQIVVNEKLQTKHSNIYAIGDVTLGPMLAHKAEDEGVAVAEQIAGQSSHINYDLVPAVVYTSPEVSSVGKTEEQLKAENQDFKVGKFSFMGNGRAKVNFSSDGFVKILVDKKTDKILGAHIIGPGAGDIIHEICVAMEFGACAEDLARTCHAHPTVSEAVKEAALACLDGAIHN